MKAYLNGSNNTIGTSPSTSATNYTWINSTDASGAWSATQTDRDMVVPHAMTLDRLQVQVAIAPGIGKNWALTLMVNGSASSLTCTISDTNTTASDVSNTVSLSAGDLISIRSVPTGLPATVGSIWWSIRQDATSMSGVMGGANTTASNSVTNYNGMMSNAIWASLEPSVYAVMPTAGVIKNLYIVVSVAPGAAKSYTFDIMKNGSTTGVQVVISGAAQTTGNDITNTVSFAAGDLISIRSTPSGTPTASVVTWACSFAPTIDGESLLLYGATSGPLSGTFDIPQGRGMGSWTLETSAQLMMGACTIKALYVLLTSAPNNGPGTQSRTLTIRSNVADTTAAVTISELATTGNVTGQSISISDGDKLSIGDVDLSTPAATQVKFGVLLFVSPGGSPTIPEFNNTNFFLFL